MAKINKLFSALLILKKYIGSESEYDVSSYEDENTITVNLHGEVVSTSDKVLLEEIGAYYDEDFGFWFVG